MSSSRLLALPAAVFAALAACVSFGSVAFNSGPSTPLGAGERIGVIPLDAAHLAIAACAGLVVLAVGWASGRGRAVAIAVTPLILVLLPWLPFGVPPAFLAWTGGLSSLVWLAVAIGVGIAAFEGRVTFYHRPRRRRPALLPGVLAFAIFSWAAWAASPSIPGGDEPHYLIITQSLLYDHDLQIENNHRRGDYHAYFAGDLQPDSIRRGRNGQIYSIHAPGVPALVLPAFAIAGYHAVVIFLILLASAACALAWWLAWRVTGSAPAAWFGWAAVTLSAPFLLESYTVYPDGVGAVVVVTGFWALIRTDWERSTLDDAPSSAWPWVLHGAALALLPWMHTRFAVLAATLGGLILVRLAHTKNATSKAIAFLAAPAVSALAWLFFFAIIYGTPDPSAPYGGRVDNSFAYLPNGLGGVLFDQGFGLFATAPVLLVAVTGFARTRRLGLEWAVMSAPYVLAVTTFAMWWAGQSGPARFLVPMVLPLAIPAACAWAATKSRGMRVVMIAALAVSAWMAIVMAGAGGGRLGYHTRNDAGMTAAPWLEWTDHLVDLPNAAPAFVPLPVGTAVDARMTAARSGFEETVPWAFAFGIAAWLIVWLVNRTTWTLAAATALATLAFGAAAMAATTIVWAANGDAPVTTVPAQMDVLREVASSRSVAFDLTEHRRITTADALAMQIEAPVRTVRRGGPRGLNRPLAVFPLLPAGSYTITVRRHGTGDGWVMAGVGNDQFAIVTQPIAAYDAGVRIDLPVAVRAISVRADEGARAQLDAIVLRPLSVEPASIGGIAGGDADVARRAVRYDALRVFFLDDRAFPEPSGFWVGGSRDTTVVVAPDARQPSQAFIVRNAPVANTVTLQAGDWHQELTLAPGEERRIEIPLDTARGIARLHIASAAGFRPSEVDRVSHDSRFLGVFVRLP